MKIDSHNSVQYLLVGMLADPSIIVECDISGISLDSRQVIAGGLFIALAKDNQQRLHHMQQAVEAGAAVILFLAEQSLLEAESELLIKANINAYPVKKLANKVSEIAARFYRHPSLALNIIAVTGTNGKTSVSQFIAQSLEVLGHGCGVVGTLGVGRINALNDSGMTTPDPVLLQQVLADFCQQGIKYVVIEASSHALAQGRLNSVAVEIAVLTNLSRDHLDYHLTMEAYGEAKALLFGFDSVRTAVINDCDNFGQQLIKQLQARGSIDIVSYSANKAEVNTNYYAENISLNRQGLQFDLLTGNNRQLIQSPLLGQFNIDNLLAATASLIALGFEFTEVSSAINNCRAVKGRMEVVASNNTPALVIDFAHTPDALAQALLSLQQHINADGKLWCVFGCGGDRDRGKRSLMGQAADKYADVIVLTDDNPRSEKPEKIIKDILQGIEEQAEVVIEHDRKSAISHAIKQAQKNDLILIAGKGHEQYQEVSGVKHVFSDEKVVLELIASNDPSSLDIGDVS